MKQSGEHAQPKFVWTSHRLTFTNIDNFEIWSVGSRMQLTTKTAQKNQKKSSRWARNVHVYSYSRADKAVFRFDLLTGGIPGIVWNINSS